MLANACGHGKLCESLLQVDQPPSRLLATGHWRLDTAPPSCKWALARTLAAIPSRDGDACSQAQHRCVCVCSQAWLPARCRRS